MKCEHSSGHVVYPYVFLALSCILLIDQLYYHLLTPFGFPLYAPQDKKTDDYYADLGPELLIEGQYYDMIIGYVHCYDFLDK